LGIDHVAYSPSRHSKYLREGKDVRDTIILVFLSTREAVAAVIIEELVVGLVDYEPCVV
jgi:hypothetical protein